MESEVSIVGKKLNTVLGPVSADSLGIILPHEHIFINLIHQFTEPSDEQKIQLSRQQITLQNYGALRRNPYAIKSNLILDDPEIAVEELMQFKNAGGNTIVDCTSIGIGRNPKLLKLIAERTGLNTIAGCGYYTHDTHPSELAGWSKEEIAEKIVRELKTGMDDSDIRAGVIGEIGISSPMHPNERKVLEAVAIAWNIVDSPIQIHTFPWGDEGLEAVDLLVKNGVNPGRIVICHSDVMLDVNYMVELLKIGIFVEFDDFGKEFYINPSDRGFAGGSFPTDLERVHTIMHLCDLGYEKQILIANDICLKQMLHKYGGWGYDHILSNIVPMMLYEGIPSNIIDSFVKHNPANWLAV